MATGIFYLRPSADISLGHTVYPADLSDGYLAINEEVSDGSTTTIRTPSTDDSSISATSSFKMSASNLENIVSVNHVTVAGSISVQQEFETYDDITIYVNSINVQTVRLQKAYDGKYTLVEVEAPDVVTAINNYLSVNGSFPNIEIQVYSSAYHSAEKNWDPYIHTSQIYIQLECEFMPGIYTKNNGEWKCAKTTYQKQNGSWVKITENETKTILSSKLVIDKCAFRGHIEISIADIAATCTETGMTGGRKCSHCGKIVKEHDTVIPALGHNAVASAGTATCTEDGMIGGTNCSRCGITLTEHNTVQPALGHSYYSNGNCRRCSVTSPDRFSFTIKRSTGTSATTYYSMPNLTWGEWVNDDYNSVVGWQITSDGSVRYFFTIFGTTDFTIDGVKSTDLIIAGHAYTATDATTS